MSTYEFDSTQRITSAFPNNNMTIHAENEQEILSGDQNIDYGVLLTAIADKYGLDDISDYENPDKVRISYDILGSGTDWSQTLKLEIDVTQKDFGRVIDSIGPVREKLEEENIENWGDLKKEYLTTKTTETHRYPDAEISRTEMEELVDDFLEK